MTRAEDSKLPDAGYRLPDTGIWNQIFQIFVPFCGHIKY
jgi:hypothetical protein